MYKGRTSIFCRGMFRPALSARWLHLPVPLMRPFPVALPASKFDKLNTGKQTVRWLQYVRKLTVFYIPVFKNKTFLL